MSTTRYRLVYPRGSELLRVAHENFVINIRSGRVPDLRLPNIVQRAWLARYSGKMMVVADTRRT